MAHFTVWAPSAKHVDILITDQRLPMTRATDGWWETDVDSAEPGADYRYSVDGSDPYPDPRSLWQPEGIHGPSRVYDHEAFTWTDQSWRGRPLSSAALYEMHIGTFTPEGTFDSSIERLPHLVDLGITHIEIMPVNEFSGERGWGYDGVGFYAPHHAYGGPDGLKRLVNACHEIGLGVVLDVVYNHFGPEGAYTRHFAPYHTKGHQSPWGDAINYDGPRSDEVRRFFIDNALMWLRDYHMDGLRLDAVHTILDTSAQHILEQLSEEVWVLEGHVGRPLFLIAESDANDPRIVRAREAGGYGIHAQWVDDFRHSLHTVLTGEQTGFHADYGTIGDLCTSFRQAYVYCGRYSRYRDRCHGRPPVGLHGNKFVGYLQNHDQIGNRAGGERSSHLLNDRLLKVAAALVLTSPFTPMLFQGEEWGASSPFLYFTDHHDPVLAKAVTQGRRTDFAAFGWNWDEVPDPQDLETFTRSKLNWNEVNNPQHASLLQWHRDLLRLRRREPDLTDCRLDHVQTAHDEEKRWLRVRRGHITVAANFANAEQTIPLTLSQPTILLASAEGVRIEDGHAIMPPESAVILRA